MKEPTLVIEEGELPVVFSPSPDSPAAPYLVEYRPSSLSEMYELGILPPSIPLEHLEEAREVAQRVSLPDAVFMDERGQWVGDAEVPGLTLLRRKAAVVQEAVRRSAAHLERRGHESSLATLAAQRAAAILAPIDVGPLIWRRVELNDLEVAGILWVDRGIAAFKARNVFFRYRGWIVPEGGHFMLTCDKVHGEPPPPAVLLKIWYEIAGVGPDPGPIEGWTDRLAVSEVRRRAAQVTRGWR